MSVDTADEDRLVERARGGDQQAFNELAARYSTRLRRTLFRITRDCDAAYDAVQEALLRAWQGIDRFEGRSRFYTWLTRIGINEAYRGMRAPVEESLELDDRVGKRVASPLVTAYSDPALPGYGYYKYDHEGTPARRVRNRTTIT